MFLVFQTYMISAGNTKAQTREFNVTWTLNKLSDLVLNHLGDVGASSSQNRWTERKPSTIYNEGRRFHFCSNKNQNTLKTEKKRITKPGMWAKTMNMSALQKSGTRAPFWAALEAGALYIKLRTSLPHGFWCMRKNLQKHFKNQPKKLFNFLRFKNVASN